jgi:pilus assembly protein FimV
MKRTELPAERAVGTSSKSKWQASALAVAVAAALTFPASDAQALALGRITVQSALGEPLRAEIDVPEISAEEAATLRVGVAPQAAFRAAGVEFNPLLNSINVSLQRRPDGRYVLRLTSDRVLNDPFIDMLVEAAWANGRLVRDFTLLLDPPAARQAPPPVAAQAAPRSGTGAATAPAPSGQATPRAAAPRAAGPSAADSSPPAPAAQGRSQPAPAGAGEGGQVTVRPGDTAGRIAAANKPAAVSLDQMLVAMLRANPEAFSGGNVNRLRAGAVLNLPSQEQAAAVAPAEASQVLVAQSRDFNEFRRRLAESLPASATPGAGREARGQVQAQVEDRKPAAAAPDKLQLSKGAVQGKANEDQIARQRAAQDAGTRVAELNRNMAELQGLAANAPRAGASGPAAAARPGASAPAVGLPVPAVPGAARPASAPAAAASGPTPTLPAAAASRPASAPAVPAAAAAATPAAPASAAALPASAAQPAASAAVAAASAPQQAASAAAAPAGAASEPAAAQAPAEPASAAAASAPAAAPKPAAPPPPPPPEPSLVDALLEDPMVPAAGGGILALLAALGIWKLRQRRKAASVDSSFLESRLQPDSFFGASGGQRVDTAEGPATGSSLVYSPSQLDAAGDVDPVAEADVYLAYGRDLQAEEILKEALRINPQRVAIHAKLLEIYAKRRDTAAFEQVARDAQAVTQGEGSEWARLCEMGQELDPSNPLYRGGDSAAPAPSTAAFAAGAAAAGLATQPVAAFEDPLATVKQAAQPAGGVDLDLDLDFSLDDPAPATAPVAPAMAPVAAAPAADAPLDMSFDLPLAATPAPQAPAVEAPSLMLPEADDAGLAFDLSEPTPTAPAPIMSNVPSAAPVAEPGMIEFDLGALSLDLPGSAPAAAPADAGATTAGGELSTAGMDLGEDDPLATKLALAQEFNAIGDADGARSLAQEVIAEASGDLKSRAQKFLAEIG